MLSTPFSRNFGSKSIPRKSFELIKEIGKLSGELTATLLFFGIAAYEKRQLWMWGLLTGGLRGWL